MDQNLIAGLGNIYATEALYQAKINPERKANQLTEAEVKELHGAIRDILQRSISARGTSTDNYRDAEGKKGNFQYQLQVYQRGGEPCSRCGAKISRTKIIFARDARSKLRYRHKGTELKIVLSNHLIFVPMFLFAPEGL